MAFLRNCKEDSSTPKSVWRSESRAYAVAAKYRTTTQLTTDIAAALARVLNLAPDNKFFEYLTRAFFFGCNLLFNVAMWAFFTAALTRASSTTRVSIINVSSNFMVTAILGLMIFGEKLPGLWWLGAGLLAVGNVIIGRREEAEKPGGTVGLDETREEAERLLDEIQDGAAIGSRSGPTENVELRETPLVDTGELGDEQSRIKKGEEADDPI